MKILFHSWEFGPGAGGIGQYLYQMARSICEYGHSVVVVAGRNGSSPKHVEGEAGIVYRVYDRKEVRSRRIGDLVLTIATKHKVDVIEGTDHWGECARIIDALDRPPVVIKYHSCQYLNNLRVASEMFLWQKFTIALALLRSWGQVCAEKKCIQQADASIAPSKKIIQELLKQGAKLPARRTLIPNMLSHIPVLSAYEEADVPSLLFVGRIEGLKGIQYLPYILGQVIKKYPDTVLEIAGGDQYARGLGSLKEWLKRRMGSLVSNVRFLGPLPPKELDMAYRRCWLFVYPTKWDNFPMALLEAMSYARPVVTTPNGGMPEMLEGTDAPVCDPASPEFGEKVIELIGDAALRRKIGLACRERVLTKYMPQQIIPKYIEFMESCC